MFKCKLSNICIHFGDICDGKEDCTKGDDEYLCPLNGQSCPMGCQCLTFVIRCLKVKKSDHSFTTIPYFIFQLKDCSRLFSETLLLGAIKIVLLKMNYNSMDIICYKINYGETVHMDAAFNNISILLSNCFGKSTKMKAIKLNSNKIKIIQQNTFFNLTSLISVNLANNLLDEIPPCMIMKSNNLIILSLVNNSLRSISVDSFEVFVVRYFLTNDYRVCCVLSENVKCPTKPPWYKSCSNLLPNSYLKVTFYFLSSLIITENIIGVLCQKYIKSKGAFDIIVKCVILSDLLCGAHISVLSIADLIFSGKFALVEEKWTSHPLCFLAFGLSLNFSLFSPCILTFMSISRLLVVMYPLDPKLKDKRLLLKYVSTLFILTLTLACIFAGSMYHFYEKVPLSLCSPFVDPNNEVILIRMITWVTVFLQFVSVLFIITVYGMLFKELLLFKKKFKRAISKKKSHSALIIQIVIVTGSNIICWIPSGVIYLVSIFKDRYPIQMIVWTTISGTTINSVINPLVFIITYMRKEIN